jgi:alkylation response protein AidB-like acyl-CoA dehydrogenase
LKASELADLVADPGSSDADVRTGVAEWAREGVPAGWRDWMRGASEAKFVDFQRDWFGRLREAGIVAPHWPLDWGGAGCSLSRQAIIAEELARAGAPQILVNSVALFHAAATLTHAGSDAQRRRHLPAILAGEVWCQGFSEPGAGSDLAGLQTRARRDGERFVVNGQKIWSSYAQYADFCLLLARSDPEAPKRKGISFLILDLKSAGVEVRPIRQSTGEQEFCELFLDDVEIPVDCLIGEENEGWRVAQQTLAAERGVQVLDQVERLSGTVGRFAADVKRVTEERDRAAVDGGAARQELGGIIAEAEILRSICHRMLTDLERHGGAGPEASILKLMYSETLQRLDDAGTRLVGLEAQVERPLLRGASWESGDWLIDYLASWAWTVGGGTSEILRNVVAERVLGLPREPEVAS